MNTVSLLGRLTRDVDLIYSPNGVAIGTFTLAVNRRFKNQQGEYDADFIRCKAFKKTAEIIAEYVKKGQQLAVTGQIQTGSYEKDGRTVYTTDVIVDNFTFVGQGNQNTGGYQQSNAANNAYQTAPSPQTGQPLDISDDDLPF